MAHYRLEAKIFAREKTGRTVVAASAYRTASKLRDEQTGKLHDYTRRSQGVVQTTILTPDGAPEWAKHSATLWNAVERSEKRVDAQLAREFILAVPHELSSDDQFALAVGWAQKELVAKGMIAEVSLHHPKSGRNPHVHILVTLRPLDGDRFHAKKERAWNDVNLLRDQRESWAVAVNTALEHAGRSERVDHRSLKDQGIDRIPEPKIGVAATAMKRRGVVEDPERFKLVRYVKSLNFARPWLKAIEKGGEVYQRGMGSTWWERSLIFATKARRAVRDVVRGTVKDTWSRMMNTSRLHGMGIPGHNLPSHDRGPGMER